MSHFNHWFALQGRHPEIVADSAVREWISRNGVIGWTENAITPDRQQTIILESLDQFQVAAVRLRLPPEGAEAHQWEPVVTGFHVFDMVQTGNFRAKAVFSLGQTEKLSDFPLVDIRPLMNWQVPDLEWQVIWQVDHHVWEAIVSRRGEVVERNIRYSCDEPWPSENSNPSCSRETDTLASNALHHPDKLRATALQMVDGETVPLKQARRIYRCFAYGEGPVRMLYHKKCPRHIVDFTWSDELIMKQSNWSGVCDEWSVMQISLLRSLGIPAEMKLIWHFTGGACEAHTCIEFFVEDQWHHMDPLHRAWQKRGLYRNKGWKCIRIADMFCPLDNRSNGPTIGGIVDPPDDGKFNPFADFLYNPSPCGERRPEYSD